MLRCLLCLVGVHFVASTSLATQPPASRTESVEQAEECYFKYKGERFLTGHVVFWKETWDHLKGDSAYRYDVWFENDQIRLDRQGPVKPGESWGLPSRFVVTDDYYIRYFRNDTAASKGPVAEYEDVYYQYQIFHPRALGTDLTGITTSIPVNGLRSVLGRNDRSDLQFSVDDDNADLYRISYRLESSPFADKPKRTVWLDHTKGCNIVAAESIGVGSNGPFHITLNVQLAEYQEETWFPSAISLETRRDGKVIRKVVAKTESAEFGIDVDDSLFTLEGMGLPENVLISDRMKTLAYNYRVVDNKIVPEIPEHLIRRIASVRI